MNAQNTTNAAATAMGYGLAVSRAVGRLSRELRGLLTIDAEAWAPLIDIDAGDRKDARTLDKAGLVRRSGAAGALAWKLTDAGRELAARL